MRIGIFYFLSIFSFFIANASATDFTCANPKAFTPLYSQNLYGKLIIAGNTSLCYNNGGVCGNPGSNTNNNINMMYNDYDDVNGTTDNTTTVNNSSAAYINIPAGKTVLWAGLTWQGYMVNWTDAQKEAGHQIKYKHDSDTSYQIETNAQMNWVYFDASRMYYQGFVDITSYVNAHKGGYYWVGDIATTQGQPVGGSFGAWSIAVIYEDENEDFNNLTVYSGYQAFAGSTDINNAISYASNHGCSTSNTGVGNSVSSTLTGFLTPKSGTVNSSLVVFAGEGDIGLSGDSGSITDGSGVTHSLSNALNPSTNIMNATISYNGTTVNSGIPYYSANTLGADIDTFDVSGILSNKQTSTNITFSTSGDGYMPGLYGLQTQLYVPQLCYDYAYKQQGVYFTEENDGTQNPKLTGNVLTNEPIEMSFFIRNLVDSDITITDMNVSVSDINTSQTTYIRDTTRVALRTDVLPVPIADSSLQVSDSYIKGLNIGSMDSNDHFYVYYNLNPLVSTLNDPIKVTANYNITVAGVTIPYNLTMGKNLNMCSSSNFAYTPSEGIYNIVHNNYYDLDIGGSNAYYNLPTQVVNREGNFKILSFDANNTNALAARGTMVGVELIDAAAYHDTEASCMEQASAISPRVWVLLFDTVNEQNTTSVPFNQATIAAAIADRRTEPLMTSSSEFYSYARENAALRIVYELTNDGNDDLLKITPGSKPNTYSINFTELVQDIGQCAKPVWNPQNYNNKTTNVAVACSNNSDKMTARDIAVCLECVHGYNTKRICSRDNFSIRPEGFLMQLDDQVQTNPATQSDITTLAHSGSVGAVAPEFHLAAGYQYNLEINATNFLGNTSSSGYTKTMNLTTADPAMFQWTPRSAITSGACNDENNSTITMRFLNGSVDINTSLNQTGEYTLLALDTTWTDVDHNPLYMAHHTGAYFLNSNIPDCIVGSNTVEPINSGINNGCNISSSHLANNTIQYNSYELTFHPYKFSIGNTLTVGSENKTVAEKPYVYMANIDENESISVHLNTGISALGYNNSALSNYVTGCFSKDTLFKIGKSPTTATNVSYSYMTHDLNASAARIAGLDINGTIAAGNVNTSPLMTLPANFWQKDQNGVLQILTNLNFNRLKNVSINPEDINYTIIEHNDTANTFYADLVNNKYADGNFTIGQNVMHYYGKTHAPKITVACDASPCSTGVGNNLYNTQELIYFTVYCNPTTTTCSTATNLPPGSVQTNDIRWWANTYHDVNVSQYADGSIGTISEIAATGNVAENAGARTQVTTYKYDSIITYNGPFPYDATMQMFSSPWLIYDENNASATSNKFIIQFIGNSDWSGQHEEDTTTNVIGIPTTKGRVQW